MRMRGGFEWVPNVVLWSCDSAGGGRNELRFVYSSLKRPSKKEPGYRAVIADTMNAHTEHESFQLLLFPQRWDGVKKSVCVVQALNPISGHGKSAQYTAFRGLAGCHPEGMTIDHTIYI